MGDVQLASTTQIPKSSLGLGSVPLRSEPPAFVVPPRNARVTVGSTARLEGKVRGSPEPKVTWYRDGTPLINGERIIMEQSARGTFSLVLQGVQDGDAGCYTCEAVNNSGSRQVTLELIVEGRPGKTFNLPSTSRATGGRFGVPTLENRPSIWGESPPKFVTKPTRLYLKVGQNGKFSAKITGRPQPGVLWHKGDVELQPDGHFATYERLGVHFLEVIEAQAEDAGVYMCSVFNSAGKATANAELIIQGSSNVTDFCPSSSINAAQKTTDVPEIQSKSNGLKATQTASRVFEKSNTKEAHNTGAEYKAKAQTSSEMVATSPIHTSVPRGDADVRTRTQSPTMSHRPQNMVKSGSEPLCDAAMEPKWSKKEAGASMPPQIILQPQNQEVLEGSKVIFKCQVSGTPPPALSWTREGRVIWVRPGLGIQQEEDQHQLCLEQVRMEDDGEYSCTASSSAGTVTAHWTLTVRSPKDEGRPPVFTSRLKDCTVSEGQSFTLQCCVEGRPIPHITWQLNDQPIPSCQGTFERGVAQLQIQSSIPGDSGSYTCVAENVHGRITCNATVLVRAKKTTQKAKPSMGVEAKKPLVPVFLRGLQNMKVMDGSLVCMVVQLTGFPEPQVAWLHNGQPVQESEDFHFEREGNEFRLIIQEVFPEDTGRYTCEAWNELGGARTEAVLTVQEPQDGVQPWFITKPKSTTASPGQHILLSCAIAGDPFPEFLWKKDGQVLSSGVDLEILQKEDVVSLLIRRIKPQHAGDYEIILRNKVGDCSCVAHILVDEDPMGSVGEPPDFEVSQGVGCVDRTEQGRRAAGQHQEPVVTRGLLKRHVETREHGEERIRQQEAEQRDFRCLLGRRVATKSVSEDELKEANAEQMDFRANLHRQVKPKTLSEEDRKVSSPQQVDFRAVLGKKPLAPKGSSSAPDKSDPPNNATPDFRSILGNKKKPNAVENSVNTETPALAAIEEKPKNDTNCVDDGIINKKNGDAGKEPEFTQMLKDVMVTDGERLRLECRVTGDPTPVITWTLDGKAVKPSKFILLSNEEDLCSLTIDKALPEDEGQYKCTAENPAGRAECGCMVLVDDPTDSSSTTPDKKNKKGTTPTTENEARIKKKPAPKTPPKHASPPQILQFPEDMKILAGEKVDLLCKFGGAPPITCTWLKFRKPIVEGKGGISIETMESTSQLTISSAKHDHSGCYTIEAHNKFGTRQASLNLTIVDKPDPPARVPAASDIRRSTLTLSWYGPTYDGGSAVQSYNLEIWNSIDKEWTPLASCNSTSYNVQNLLPDMQYKFRVRAVNIYGIGEPSAESEPVTVGEEEEEKKKEEEEEEEAEASDDDKEPEYRDVVIKNDKKVQEFYDVEERLGTGKFGQVFKIVEKSTKKVWAGKFIKAFSAKEKDNVRQEISIMNCLHHPKLVQCVDAFEGRSDIVMVMELISGGELFERIIDEDFELSEREVIKYMLQIVDGVQFIHKQGIVHLDLKPENIMCVNKMGSKIKLIDFGLARRLESSGSLKVLFGTPEFVAPEVINYEPIGYPTDMWSIGVICYILVSGLSPFMGDNDNETLSNVTSATWDFEDEAFDEISEEAKDFISQLLKKDLKARLTCAQCLEHPWLKQDTKNMEAKKLSKERMKKYMLRRKWQKTGHAVRAIGRLSSMAMLSGISAKKGGSPTGNPSEDDLSNKVLESMEEEERPHVKASFSLVIKDVEVVEGSAARFDCKIEGYPDPEVVWYKDDQPIKETRHFQIDYDEEGNCSLVISEVTRDDDAKYTCKAVNALGEDTCTAELLVEFMAEEEEEEE